MSTDNRRIGITTFVLVDTNGKVIDDFENVSENTEVRAIGIEPENNL